MKVRFFIDPETSEPHFRNHGLNEDEVTEAFESRIEDCRGRKDTRVAVGKTAAGRVLKIIFSVATGDFFIITAYPLDGKELKAFKRRRK